MDGPSDVVVLACQICQQRTQFSRRNSRDLMSRHHIASAFDLENRMQAFYGSDAWFHWIERYDHSGRQTVNQIGLKIERKPSISGIL
jgi:hypothetical protein